MNTNIKLAAVAALALAVLPLTACGGSDKAEAVAPTSTTPTSTTSSAPRTTTSTPTTKPQLYGPDRDEVFLASLTKYNFTGSSDVSLIDLAHTVCSGLSTSPGIVRGILVDSGFGQAVDDYMMASTLAYCPDQMHALPPRS